MHYKKDLNRIEDAIIPFIIEALILSHIDQLPSRASAYANALELIDVDIKANLTTDKLIRRATRIERKVLKFWEKNKTEIRKSYMVMSYLASALTDQEAVALGDSTQQVLLDTNDTITKAYDDEAIVKLDISAAKQMPKVLKLLQEEGLF